MSKVLITGGAGFIGFSVAEELESEGYDVTILDNKKDGKNTLNWMMAEQCGIKRIHGSINHLLPWGNLGGDMDAIVHCAAQTAVTKSLEDPHHDFITNAEGTFNVCEFARKHDAKIIYTSTNKVYGDNVNKISLKESGLPYKEFPPNHIWRHTFAQDFLSASEWKYELCASLGGWKSSGILKKHYGEMSNEAKVIGLRKAMGLPVKEKEIKLLKW